MRNSRIADRMVNGNTAGERNTHGRYDFCGKADGLWADIEAAMRAKRKRVLLSPLVFRRAAAVAACVAVVVGAGWMLFSHDSQVVLPSALSGGSSDAPVAASGMRPRGQVVSEVRKLLYGGREAMVVKTDVMRDSVVLSSVSDDEIVAGDVADTAAVGGKQVNEGGRPALRRGLSYGDGRSHTADVMLASSSRSSGRHTGGLSVGVYGAGLTSLGGGSGMGGETFQFTCYQVFGNDTACTSVDDDNILHFIAGVQFYCTCTYLTAQCRVSTQQ